MSIIWHDDEEPTITTAPQPMNSFGEIMWHDEDEEETPAPTPAPRIPHTPIQPASLFEPGAGSVVPQLINVEEEERSYAAESEAKQLQKEREKEEKNRNTELLWEGTRAGARSAPEAGLLWNEMIRKALPESVAEETLEIPGIPEAEGIMDIGTKKVSEGYRQGIKSPELQHPEDFKMPEGIWEGFVFTAPQFVGQAAATAVGGHALGTLAMFGQIAGGQYSQLIDEGVDENRAMALSIVNGLVQAPLEQIGMKGILKAFQPKTQFLKRMKNWVAGGFTEGLTEMLQKYPEEITTMIAKNPGTEMADMGKMILDNVYEWTKEGVSYDLPIGMMMGLAMGSGGLIRHAPTEMPKAKDTRGRAEKIKDYFKDTYNIEAQFEPHIPFATPADEDLQRKRVIAEGAKIREQGEPAPLTVRDIEEEGRQAAQPEKLKYKPAETPRAKQAVQITEAAQRAINKRNVDVEFMDALQETIDELAPAKTATELRKEGQLKTTLPPRIVTPVMVEQAQRKAEVKRMAKEIEQKGQGYDGKPLVNSKTGLPFKTEAEAQVAITRLKQENPKFKNWEWEVTKANVNKNEGFGLKPVRPMKRTAAIVRNALRKDSDTTVGDIYRSVKEKAPEEKATRQEVAKLVKQQVVSIPHTESSLTAEYEKLGRKDFQHKYNPVNMEAGLVKELTDAGVERTEAKKRVRAALNKYAKIYDVVNTKDAETVGAAEAVGLKAKKKTTRVEKRQQRQERSNRSREIRKSLRENPKPWAEMSKEELIETSSMLLEESGMTKLPVYKGKQFGQWSKQDHIGWLEETGAFDHTPKEKAVELKAKKKKKPILGEEVKVQTEEGLGQIIRKIDKGQWEVRIIEGEEKGEVYPYGEEELEAPGHEFPKREAVPETEQLDLFPDGLSKAIKEAEKAIGQLDETWVEGDVTTHGVGITVAIKRGRALNIRGKKIENRADAANVFQVFRDPRFESSRVLYLKNGIVVHQEGVTAGLPGQTPTHRDFNLRDITARLDENLKRYSADQIIITHNHPSGNAEASDADIQTFKNTHRYLEENGYDDVSKALKYEVIIDSGKYGFVERTPTGFRNGVEALKGLPKNWTDPLMQPTLPSLGLLKISHKNRAAGIARRMGLGKGTVGIMFLDHDLRVRVIQEIPVEMFEDKDRVQKHLRKVGKDHGAPTVYIYTSKHDQGVWDRGAQLIRHGYIHEYFYDISTEDGKPKLGSLRNAYRSDYERAMRVSMVFGEVYEPAMKRILPESYHADTMEKITLEPMNLEMWQSKVVDKKAMDLSTDQARLKSDELGVGITTPTADGRYARGNLSKQDTVKVVADKLKELEKSKDHIFEVVETWDGFASVQEAYEYARDSMVFLDPVIVEDKKGVRWQINKNGHYGNDKMAFPNLTYPKGRNTYDFQGCGRKGFFEINNMMNLWHPNGYVADKACWGGACYAEAIIKGNGGANATIAGGILVQGTTKKTKANREEIARYVARHGVISARKKYPDFQINWFGDSFKVQKKNAKTGKFRTTRKFNSEEEARAYLNGRSGGEYRIDVVEGKGTTVGEIVNLPGPARVTTLLGPAKGQDIRLGVDTDGGAWIVHPEVMDALLRTGAKKFSIYSSAYHQVPPKHKMSGKSIINVTVSGYHPLPETFKRLEWAKAARANGWTVILREVTADHRVFTNAELKLYNRIHEALLETDFLIMEQPLHKGKAKSKPGETEFGLPGCCKGSKANPSTCDQCEVAEGQGQLFQKFWGMKEGSLAAGKLIPDTAEFAEVQAKAPQVSDEAEAKSFKNYAGTKLARYKNKVGKMVSGKLYVHKQYAKEALPKKQLAAAERKLKNAEPDFNYNVVVHEQKTGKFWFHNSENFDTHPEPNSGEYVVVDGKETKRAKTSTIWHHKWQWVKDDYKGFDVDESFERSKDWASNEYAANKIGTPANWDKWLADNNLPPNAAKPEFDTSLAQGTARGATKKGAVGATAVVPKTVIYLGKLKKGMKLLDFGAGKGRPHADQIEAATGARVNAYDFSLEGSEVFLFEDGYDLIYASNVLNTQKVKDDPTSPKFLEYTTNQFLELLNRNPGAEIIANFPSEPRHTPSLKNKGEAMQTAEMTEWLEKHFEVRKVSRAEQRDAGIKSANDIYILAKKGEAIQRTSEISDELERDIKPSVMPHDDVNVPDSSHYTHVQLVSAYMENMFDNGQDLEMWQGEFEIKDWNEFFNIARNGTADWSEDFRRGSSRYDKEWSYDKSQKLLTVTDRSFKDAKRFFEERRAKEKARVTDEGVVRETEVSDEILSDAGFLPSEIERGVSEQGQADALAGKVFQGGDRVPVTQEMIDFKQRRVDKIKDDIARAEEGLKEFKEELVGTSVADRYLGNDARAATKKDIMAELRRRLKDAQGGVDRFKRQFARGKEEVVRAAEVTDEPRIEKTIDDVFQAEDSNFRKTMKKMFKAIRNWKTHLVDKYHPIQQILGEKAYRKYRMVAGLDSLYSAFMEDGDFKIDSNGDITIDSTTESVGEFFKNNPEANDMLKWAALQRARRLEGEVVRKGKRKGQSKERWLVGENRRIVEEYLAEKGRDDAFYQDLYDKFLVHHKSLLDILQYNGLINADQKARWTEEIYVPFHRVFQNEMGDDISGSPYSTDAIGSKLKELEGAELKLGDPLQNVLSNWAYLLKEALRNGATVNALNTALNLQAEENSLIVTVEKEAGDSTIAFMKDGRRAYFKVHDVDLFNSMRSINSKGLPGFLDIIFGKPKRWLTYGVTKTPAFVIANTTRDTISAAIVENDFIPFVDSLRGIFHIMTNSPEYIRAKAAGALFGGSYTRADNPRGAAVLAKRFMPKKGKGVILDTPAKIWSMYEKFIDASENAARVGIFLKKTRKGATDFDAAYKARDITDFANHGASEPVSYLLSAIPFLGARMQGNYKLFRAAKDNTIPFLMKGLTLSLASMALWSLYEDDDRYKELEDWDKWTYYHFWVGGTHYKIPKPFEAGVIFSSAMETAAAVSLGKEDLQFLKRFAFHAFGETLAMNPIPQVAKPAIEVWSNKSMFTGRPIESMSLKRLKPGERAYGYDSETLRMLGRGLNISPKKMQALIRGYFGNLAIGILNATDQVTRAFGDFPEEPALTTADYPVFGRFVKSGPARSTKYMTRFYDALKESNEVVATIKHYKETGNHKKALELRRDKRKAVNLNKWLRREQRQLSKLRKKSRQIYRNRIMTSEQKRRRLEAIQEQMNRIVKRAYSRYSDIL
jgi:hypothetical protein